MDTSTFTRTTRSGHTGRSPSAPASPSRRRFLVVSSTGAGGLMLGLHVPMVQGQAPSDLRATPEINVWVLIQPDETVVVRIARSEMGQGTLTGLAQLVPDVRPRGRRLAASAPQGGGETGGAARRLFLKSCSATGPASPPNTPRRARTWPATAPGATSPPAAAAASANHTTTCARAAPLPA